MDYNNALPIWENPGNNSVVVEEDDHTGWPDFYPERTVKRSISGKLAHDIRTRLQEAEDIPVFVTEIERLGSYSENTDFTDYTMVIECGETKKYFESNIGSENLSALISWLDGNEPNALEEVSSKDAVSEIMEFVQQRHPMKS